MCRRPPRRENPLALRLLPPPYDVFEHRIRFAHMLLLQDGAVLIWFSLIVVRTVSRFPCQHTYAGYVSKLLGMTAIFVSVMLVEVGVAHIGMSSLIFCSQLCYKPTNIPFSGIFGQFHGNEACDLFDLCQRHRGAVQ